MPTTQEISLNPQSATGDILSSDGSTRIRVPLGTSLQVLSAQSTASSGLQWISPPPSATAYSLIASGTLTANAQSLSLSNLSLETVGGVGTASNPYYAWLRLEISLPSKSTAGTMNSPYIIWNNRNTTGDANQQQMLWEYYTYAAINTGYNFTVVSWYGKDHGMFWNYTFDIPNMANATQFQAATRSSCGFSGSSEGYSAESHFATSFAALTTAVRLDSLSPTSLIPSGTSMALYGIRGAQY
jgi:hypothetical protein